MEEEWRPIDFTKGRHEVSSLGRVRLVQGSKMTGFAPKVLSQRFTTNGYKKVAVYCGGRYKTCLVHRLVALAFLPQPPGMDTVNHKDLDKTNNAVTNLEWSTMSANNRHAMRNGLRHAATNPKRAHKLTSEKVAMIRALARDGLRTGIIAERFGISGTVARRVINGTSWALPARSAVPHVTDDFGNLVQTTVGRMGWVVMA